MNTTKAIAERFRELDFHDDTFVSMSVLPAQTCGDVTGSVVEIQLSQYSEQKRKVLRFIGCANLRVGMDFWVLAKNLPPNTSEVDAHTDTNLIWSLMQSQMRDWGVRYADTTTPLDGKLGVINEFAFFRVQLCGGAIEIIAREYQVETVVR